MNNLLAFAGLQFSQVLTLIIFLLLVGLATYELVTFLKKSKDESMYY